jgi:hypothetical protein
MIVMSMNIPMAKMKTWNDNPSNTLIDNGKQGMGTRLVICIQLPVLFRWHKLSMISEVTIDYAKYL